MAKKEDKRAYFKVDIGYLSNPKVAELMDEHPRGVLLHLQCIAYSAQHLTDGIVPMRIAMRIACAEQCDLDAVLNAGLLRKVNGTHLEVHDYLLHQRSAESVKGLSEAGKRAAQARWDADGNAEPNANGNADRMRNPMPRERGEKETSSPAVADAKKPTRAQQLPDEWAPSEAHIRLANERGVNITDESEKFRDWCASNGTAKKDWEATFRNWIRNARTTGPATIHQLRTDDQGRTVLPPLPPRSPWGN